MKHPGTSRNARVAVRLTREEQHQVEDAARAKGYANSSAFLRAAIRNELDGRADLTGNDERIGAGFDRVSRDIFRVGRGQQALYALIDAFAKATLAGTAARSQATGHRPREGALRAARQGRRSGDVGRCARRHAGSGGPWHELTMNAKSGSGHQSLALPGTKARHGRTGSDCSCTTPAAAE